MPQVSFCSKAQRKPFMLIRTFTPILPTSKILLPRLLAAFLPTARRPKAHPMSRRPSRKRLYPIQFQRKIPKRIPPKTQPLNPTRRIIRRLLSKPSLLLTEFTSISLRRARNITILRPAAGQTPIKPLLTKLCRRARRPVRNVSNSKNA